MKRAIIASLVILCMYSCNVKTGSGNIISEIRPVAAFEGIKLSGSIDIEAKNGSNFSIVVEGDDNILPYVITEVKDDLINVHYKSGTSYRNAHVKAYITSPVIKKLIVSGSGNIVAKNVLKDNDRLECRISGSGNITAPVDAPNVEAAISGSGIINLKGRTKELEATISGSGDMKCRELRAEVSEVKISGSGNAHVFASQRLEAISSGSGNIYFSGNPQKQEIKKSGSGLIQPLN